MSFGYSSTEPPRGERSFEPWRHGADSPVRVIDDLEGLAALEPAWDQLAAPHGHPLRQFAWVRACAEAFEDDAELRIFVVERHGRLRAVAPMVQRRLPAERLELLGGRELHAPCEIFYADTDALTMLAESLADSRIAVALDGFPAGSPMLQAFEQAYQGRGWVRAMEIDPMPYIQLDASWVMPEQRLDPGLCSDLRRVLRHCESIGEVEYEIFSPASADELIARLSEIKAGPSPWTWAHASAASKRGRFIRRYAGYAAERGQLRLVMLRIGGRPVALQLAIEAEQRYWVLHMCYDEQFARLLPNMLLTVHAIGYAASAGLRSYEFLGEPETWAKRFTDNQSGCRALRTYPLNAAGYAALCTDTAHASLGARRRPANA
jgi:CelD/BcsL family acetyltransferase involved in cellulose biosynthesis